MTKLRVSPDHSTSLAQVFDALPSAIYTTDADGYITFANHAAVELAGRAPAIGRDRWCVSWRLYAADGSPLDRDQCPMAVALRERRPVRGIEILVERPDGTRVPVMPFPTPIRDTGGNFLGAVNMLVDISALREARQELMEKMSSQTALYRFTDQLYRSNNVKDIFDGALDAIGETLRCSRSSILMFDDAGVMQFTAWRGLSDAYRAAVAGHTPWKVGDRDPQPIFIEDIDAADELAPVKDVIRAEGIGALAFIPLTAEGVIAGKFMAYYERPHQFSSEEKELAVTVARQLGFALERLNTEKAREEAHAANVRLAAIIESSQDAIVSKNLDGIITSWNPGAERLFGYTASEAIGKHISILIPDSRQDEETVIMSKIRRGEHAGHYDTVRQRKDGSLVDISLMVSPLHDREGRVIGASKIARDITERRIADEQRILLIHELNHRVKNTLATVQSLALQSLRGSRRSADARSMFEGRLAAFSRAHDVLTRQSWQGAGLREIVLLTLKPFQTSDGRLTVDGPAVRLSPKQALAMSIALHELTTNAAKYGALSTEQGRVAVVWDIAPCEEGARRFCLSWTESGGPPVAKPARRGFGSRMIERHLAGELGGTVELDFRPEGLQCIITSLIDWGWQDPSGFQRASQKVC